MALHCVSSQSCVASSFSPAPAGPLNALLTAVCSPRSDPATIPWGAEDVDIVVESTGVFTTIDKVGGEDFASLAVDSAFMILIALLLIQFLVDCLW